MATRTHATIRLSSVKDSLLAEFCSSYEIGYYARTEGFDHFAVVVSIKDALKYVGEDFADHVIEWHYNYN